jgi:hypothetical protein
MLEDGASTKLAYTRLGPMKDDMDANLLEKGDACLPRTLFARRPCKKQPWP